MEAPLEHNKELVEDFIASLEDYEPTIPDEVTQYLLSKTGFNCPDIRVKRLITLAAQKFISDIAQDTMHYSKLRQAADKTQKDKSLVMTMEDLQLSLIEYGINVRKPEYFVDRPNAGKH